MVKRQIDIPQSTNKKIAKSKGNYDWILIATVFFLCTLGLTFFASSLSTKTPEIFQIEFLKQLLLGVGVGTIIAITLARINYKKILKYSKWLVWINFFFLTFLLIFIIYLEIETFGQSIVESNRNKINFIRGLSFLPIRPHIANGAIRWVDFIALPNFQPSEFTKISLLLYFAQMLLLWEQKKIDLWGLKYPIYSFLYSALCIMLQPDLGTILLIAGINLMQLWTAKVPLKILTTGGVFIFGIAAIITFSTGFRVQRIDSWLSQITGKGETSAQILRVQDALRNGGLWGKGFGQSEYKTRSLLFEQSTDAIIAVIGEEIGFVFTLLFLSLYLVILLRGIYIASHSPDFGAKAIAVGVSTWITTQAFLNIAGITGLVPLTGIVLPFVSGGGSAMVINLAAIGLLVSVSKEIQLVNK